MVLVKVLGESREIPMSGVMNGEDVLRELGLSASSTIILRNGKPVSEDSKIEEGDNLTVIRSFSGG